MGTACQCNCNDGQYELQQEQYNQVRMSASNKNDLNNSLVSHLHPLTTCTQTYNSLKPLNRRKQYYPNSQENNGVYRHTFGLVSKENAFDQTYEDLIHKLDPDPNLIFVDRYEFTTNGSEYKGQMLQITKMQGD